MHLLWKYIVTCSAWAQLSPIFSSWADHFNAPQAVGRPRVNSESWQGQGWRIYPRWGVKTPLRLWIVDGDSWPLVACVQVWMRFNAWSTSSPLCFCWKARPLKGVVLSLPWFRCLCLCVCEMWSQNSKFWQQFLHSRNAEFLSQHSTSHELFALSLNEHTCTMLSQCEVAQNAGGVLEFHVEMLLGVWI